MAEIGIRELLEAGVHFGHQTRRWNPKMRRFIFGERGGIYLVDLLQTQELLAQARHFAHDIADRGGTVLFVGTKKPARDAIKQEAEKAGMPYVNHRWLGGLLTNWQTISRRIARLHDLERYQAEGQLDLLPTKERMTAQADLVKLQANLGGVKDMQRVPDAMFVIDLKSEAIAVAEAQRLRIPIIGLVDTNCDPDGIAYVVPGNDDAMRSCSLISRAVGDVVGEGHQRFRAAEEKARAEAEEKARREAEEKARVEAEAQARREAEEQARREAAEAQAAGAGGGDTSRTAAEAGQPVAASAPAPRQQAQRGRRAPRPTAEPAGDPEAPGAPATAEQVEAATGSAPEPAPAETGNGGGVVQAARDLAGGAASAAGDVASGVVEAVQDVASGTTEAAKDVASGTTEAAKDVASGTTEAARDLAEGARRAAEDVTAPEEGQSP